MKIRLASLLVDDQEKALAFYTGMLDFVKKNDFPAGDGRWLTIVSPQAPDEVELLLEPLGMPAARTWQRELFEAGIPQAAFAVDDVHAEQARLEPQGVRFISEPVAYDGDPRGTVTMTTFDDTCGNLIMLYEDPSTQPG